MAAIEDGTSASKLKMDSNLRGGVQARVVFSAVSGQLHSTYNNGRMTTKPNSLALSSEASRREKIARGNGARPETQKA